MRGGRIAVAAFGAVLAAAVLPITGAVPRVHAAAPVAALAFSPTKVAPNGSLTAGSTAFPLLTAKDAGGAPIPGATVFLSFANHNPNSRVTVTSTGAPLSAAPQPFTADVNGSIALTFNAGASVPNTGVDTITAADAASNPNVTATDTYTYDRYALLCFSPSPLPSGATVVTLTAVASGTCTSPTTAGNVAVYLRLTNTSANPAGTATVGATPVPSSFSGSGNPFTTSNAGTISITYTASGTTGDDVLAAQDDPGATPVSATDVHHYTAAGPATSVTFDRHPIARAGSLAAGTTSQITAVPRNVTGSAVGAAPVSACLTRTTGSTASATGNGTALSTNCASPTALAADASGDVTFAYTPGNSPAGCPGAAASACLDQLHIANTTPGSGSDDVFYNYDTVAKYVFNGTPDQGNMAAEGSLTSQSPSVTFTITAEDAAGHAVADTTAFLSFAQTQAGNTGGSATSGSGPTALTSDAKPFQTDGTTGTVSVTYTIPGSLPTGGQDAVIVNADSPAGAVGARIVYDFAPTDTLAWSAVPFAPNGSLGQNGTVFVQLTASDSRNGGAGVGGAIIYLSIAATPLGSATATGANGQHALTGTPQAITADASGVISVAYKSSGSAQDHGSDAVTAADAQKSPVATATDTYGYGVVKFHDAAPTIAAPGTLLPGASTSAIQVDAPRSPNGAFLALQGGLGTAQATCQEPGGPVQANLTSDLVFCPADSSGHITIVYTTPAVLPVGGVDSLIALLDRSSTPVLGTTKKTYTYAGAIAVSAIPLAAPGSLDPGAHASPVLLTAQDGSGTPLGACVPVWIRLASTMSAPGNSTPDSASAQTGSAGTAGACPATVPTNIGADLTSILTDTNGQVSVTLTAGGAAVANSGVDLVIAENQRTSAAIVSFTTYSVRTVLSYPFAQAPPSGSLKAGQQVAFSLHVADLLGQPISGVHRVYLSSSTPGGGTFTINGQQIGSGVVALLTGSDGSLAGIFTAGNPLPSAKVADSLVADSTPQQLGVITGLFSYAYTGQGYWMVASDGGIFPFGPGAAGYGSTGSVRLNQPIVGMAVTPDGGGYWLVASDGGIFPFGDAVGHGSTGSVKLNKPIVGMASTPSGNGYWLVASDGGIFPFGDAVGHGSTGSVKLNKPIVGMARTSDGGGYWLVASDGGIFPFGDATGHGSTGSVALNKPIVGMAPTTDGGGYWLVASDGGIFPFGDATGHGSEGSVALNKPIVGMAATHDGGGYWMVASDGGIFPFGDAQGFGSTGSVALNKPIVGMTAIG